MSNASDRALRIGVVCYPTFGGSGVVATELGKGLAERGHEIHLFSYAPPARLDAFDEHLHLHEVEVSSYPLFKYPPYDLALASRLAEVAEDSDLDLVHAHYAIPHTVAGLLVKDILKPRPFPVVTTLHGTDITVVGQDPSYARVTRHAIRNSDAVTSVSTYLKTRTEEVFGLENGMHVIPNFVDTERFRPQRNPHIRGCFSRGNERVVMHVSNFRPVKRAGLAIEAFATIAEAMPSTLVMIGDGPERATCEAQAGKLGLKNRVRFLGAQTDIENLLPNADLFLLPSEYESFGLAALEAMACGVVPVVTDAGGLPEVVRDGVDGLLIDADAMETMGTRSVELLGDEERLAAMGAAARTAATDRFDRGDIISRYENVYRSVLEVVPT
ncbi:MAG: N-acetyl-alpha-D-glucosaminyl L-malate synthase BshA [Planctomycetota bacterium]|nr:N-acetyl-alpha-D-glucosaminyl L-malate synthase BshA [Planctomycetota bacterium]